MRLSALHAPVTVSCLLATAARGAVAAGPAAPTQREIVRRAMRERPGDPWPRGVGHVVLALPGSQQPEKGYHEPGGSFSPAVGSFGISIWVRGPEGKLVTTSDGIPLEQVSQSFKWDVPEGAPDIRTETPYYVASWRRLRLRTNDPLSMLTLTQRGDPANTLELVVRSVGPAGGPIRMLAWDGINLWVDPRFHIDMARRPKEVFIGHEGDPGWTENRTPENRWEGKEGDGWGYARLPVLPQVINVFWVRDAMRAEPNPLQCPAVRSALELDLPDPRFAECLDAQVAHLLMGLMDIRTPPGEPTNYPLAWQRDGATVVAALARAGRLEVTRQLVGYFAENDFFGGFGSEADAPGQGLRVMEEVASRVLDPELDRSLWPHARRKAELISTMLETREPLRRPYVGPIVPRHRGRNDLDLVCEAARDGLIHGRMDWGRPVSYVNGISFQGLLAAARLADRLKEGQEASRYRTAAEGLQKAWLAAPQWKEDRTYISALWPTWVAAPVRSSFRDQLERHSDPQAYAPWTYFSAAMAHQWLLLDRPEKVWETLEWFLGRQTSPGLYTWWEGTGEENTFDLWQDVRGWVSPPNVTPHYWTAAEVLALQVDMLAFVDESEPEPVLVIGGGVPRKWMDRPMRVRGIPTTLGVVDWSSREGKVHVSIDRRPPRVRLGSAFGAATLEVEGR